MNWPVTQIRKLCLPTNTKNPEDSPNDYFSYIDISSVDKNQKIISNSIDIIGSEAPGRARKVVQVGDVLVSTVRPNLNAVAIVPSSLNGQIASTGFCVLRPAGEIVDNKYLFYFSTTSDFVDSLVRKVRGAHYPAVTDNDVKDVEIPIPPLSEQKRIVEILEQADTLRKKRVEADKIAGRIIPAVFYQMFGDPAKNPNAYKEVSLGEITSLVTSGFTPTGGSVNYVNNGPYFLRSQNVLMNQLSLEEIVCLPLSIAKKMKRVKVGFGDVLLNITGASLGRVSWYDIPDHDAYVNQHVCIIRLTDSAKAEYVSFFLSTPYGQRLILSSQTGATRQGLNHENVRKIKIILPSKEFQEKFAKFANDYQAQNELNNQAREKIEQIFLTLLYKAFSSELTAKWREAHLQELLQEMEIQGKYLNEARA